MARIENHKYTIEEAFRECFYVPGCFRTKSHFMLVGNPAPPIPRNSAAFNSASTPSQSLVVTSFRTTPYRAFSSYGSDAHCTRACSGCGSGISSPAIALRAILSTDAAVTFVKISSLMETAGAWSHRRSEEHTSE